MSELRSFYYDGEVLVNHYVKIVETDFHHIHHVLRLEQNDLIILLATTGKFIGKIVSFEQSYVQVLIIKKEEMKVFLPRIHLIQGLPKGWKMDEIIEKSTEMGVSSIYPTYMNRSIPRYSLEEEKNKQKRWEKIAIAASKQSRRNDVPKIYSIKTLENQLETYNSFDGCKVICWELEQKRRLIEFLKENHANDYLVLIGPEGGISHEEAKIAQDKGFVPMSLGDTILRTETAAPFSVGLIAYLWNNLP